jgi:hypothetical protein
LGEKTLKELEPEHGHFIFPYVRISFKVSAGITGPTDLLVSRCEFWGSPADMAAPYPREAIAAS